MARDLSILEGGYFRDLMDQPRALRETVAGLGVSEPLDRLVARFHRGEFRSLVLTGMGSSYHGLIPLQLELVDQGWPVLVAEASELVHYQEKLLAADALLVAVSQSGRSAEIVRLLDLEGRRSPVLAITNSPDSPLAARSDAVILTRAGNEHSVSCKTYIAGLAAERWLAGILCGRDEAPTRRELGSAESLLAAYLGGWKGHVEGFAELLKDVPHLFLLGRGASLAAVGTGALIVKESAHFQAEGLSSAAFRHGPFEMLNADVLALVFAGDLKTRELNRGLWRDIREAGGRAEWIGPDAGFAPCVIPEVPGPISPTLEILPVQMMTLALALLAGREPGRFSLAAKVTDRE